MTCGGVRGKDEEGRGRGYPWKGTGRLFQYGWETRNKDSEVSYVRMSEGSR